MGGVVVVVVIPVRLAIDSTLVVRCDISLLDATTMDNNGACIEFLSSKAQLSNPVHDHY